MKVLITGGSRGIGRAIAEQLAKAGHDLLLVSKNQDNLQKAASDIESAWGRKVKVFPCNVGSNDDLNALSEFCKGVEYSPDVLILSAGIFIEGSLTEGPAADFEETLNINFLSIYHTVRLFIQQMKSNPRAKIILIGSTAAYEPYPIGPLYGVAKWALRGYAINLRKELMKDNIGVVFLVPGGTLTDLWAGEALPDNRLLEPADIGKLVASILTLSNQAVVEELIVRPMLGDIHE